MKLHLTSCALLSPSLYQALFLFFYTICLTATINNQLTQLRVTYLANLLSVNFVIFRDRDLKFGDNVYFEFVQEKSLKSA